MNKLQNLVTNPETNQQGTPKEILQNHLNSFLENNLEALMADFSNKSVLITPDATYSGLKEIKSFYYDLMLHFPKQKSGIELESTVINDHLIYIVWHGKSPSLEVPFATDTFIIRKGKIYRQTFAGQVQFIG